MCIVDFLDTKKGNLFGEIIAENFNNVWKDTDIKFPEASKDSMNLTKTNFFWAMLSLDSPKLKTKRKL